ncbi:hypothetical protein OSB04_023398 [Centaurea solstitialis]|uniref:DEUBAD domain-containing protein n=1 Tax=Centaurea solstitialis TaxID=347529 RepID=A0AA38SXG1_9ASTR|nr:hypothetical protein OSB04_023398 [Centaurea solstitialis]
MAIEKNSFKVVRLESEFSSRSREESMSSEDDEFQKRGGGGGVEFDEDEDDYDDCDSGAGSDDFDLLELGETGEEFCQIGDQTCSIPFELYDLTGLGDILSMEVWNDVLTDDDRLNLAKYLPDMDQEHFMRTMKELFTGCNFHFGVPINKLFDMLKGGLCEPRVSLYRQGLGFFQKHRHYHIIRKHQNTMVNNIFQIREAWMKCRGYSIEEKLRVLNIMKSQKSLMYEKMEELETDSSEWEESGDGLWNNKKPKDRIPKRGRFLGYRSSPTLDFPNSGRQLALEPANLGKQNPKGTLKVSGSKISTTKEHVFPFSSLEVRPGPSGSASFLPRQMRDHHFRDEEKSMYDVTVHRDHNFPDKVGKKYKGMRGEEFPEAFMGLPVPLKTDVHAFGRNRTVNQLSDIKVLTSKPSNSRLSYDYGKKLKHPENNQKVSAEDALKYRNPRAGNLSQIDSQHDMYAGGEPFWPNQSQGELISSYPYRMGQKKGRAVNGGRVVAAAEGMKMLAKGEETESDSSEQFGEDDEDNPLMRSKWAYPSGASTMKSGPSFKKAKLVKNNNKGSVKVLDESLQTSRKNGDFGEEIYLMKGKQKGKNRFDDSNARHLDEFNGDGHIEGIYKQSEIFQVPFRKTYPSGKKQKGEFGRDYSVLPQMHINDYIADEPGRDTVYVGRSSKKGQMIESYSHDRVEMADVRLLGCNSASKKRKVKDELMFIDEQENLGFPNSSPHQQLDDVTYVKSLGKRKWTEPIPFENVIAEAPVMDTPEEEAELESKTQKKPFTLITPTVHTGFSFSIIHLLSAVRMAMVTLLPEDSMDVGKNHNVSDERQNPGEELKQDVLNGDQGVTSSDPPVNPNVPSLTVKDIVNRVKSNPGDPCILETQEPLQDLVRGVLKLFSSKTAPLGAKGWKSLVLYKKSIKSWSWIGPVSQSSSDHEIVEEVTSPDSWGLPHKMLVKLVDSFANWLKSGQETLQQIGSLPAPPLTLMQLNLDEKERFRDLRAQKSLNTINPSSEEVRDYFRKEEVLRYLIPDRAFAYTAVDGKKSTVAPSRKGAGKPTSKARDHFMLKRDRPPHVTILCLVRDAAARLPGSIGTRADVCTLIRDSQYIVEDVSDAQVNQVVSGALDRLHYERDPCVQFDGDRKLWVYLHREREEEDFEDDGTSSTKKWKRQKKESAEPSDQGAVTLAYQGSGEQSGFDLTSDLNIEPSGVVDEKKEQPLDDNFGGEQGAVHHGSSMGWEALGLDNKLLCEKNSTNEDFDDRREEDAELLNTSVS